MAPSSSDISVIDSTSRALADLHLIQEQDQNMEGMETDQLMDVPDTPDRLAASQINGSSIVSSSVTNNTENGGLRDWAIPNGPIGNHRQRASRNRKILFHHHPRDRGNHDEIRKSESDNVPISGINNPENEQLFRRTRLPDRSSKKADCDTVLDLNKPPLHIPSSSRGFPTPLIDRVKLGSSSDIMEITAANGIIQGGNRGKEIDLTHKIPLKTSHSTKGIRSGLPVGLIKEPRNKTLASDVFNIDNFLETSTNISKGDIYDTYDGAGTSMKNADSQSKTQQSVTSSRNTGQRRLVRNGYISPLNIARAKSASESRFQDNTEGNFNSSDGVPSCPVLIVSPGSVSNQIHAMKGKGIMNDTILANAHDAERGSSSSRILVTPGEETNVNGDTDDGIFRSVEEIRGSRSTRNRSKNPSLLSSRDSGICKRSDDIHRSSDGRDGNKMDDRDFVTGVNDSSEIDFLGVMTESDQQNGRHRGAQKMMKRQRKSPLTRTHLGESSSSFFDGSDVSYLRSSGPNVKSTRTRNSRRHPIVGPVIELDELGSPEIGRNNIRDGLSIVNEHSSERARQVEADEVLARQLQEQFYHESPVAGGAEIDASIAWTMQQEEDAQLASSIGSRDLSHSRNSSIAHLYRQYPQRSFQNSSLRSTNRARLYTSSRMAELRRSFRGRTPRASQAEMSFLFPSNMDFETRIHILEALEADVGNSNDMAMPDRFFQRHLDFNENDYEMLLALDENNHQHGGASVAQINGLPQSTVQTDNFEEPCAVCLETPTIGDTIRHLPCLHKFHKECIDPWLRRKTSCPICKSGIR